jgi:formamidopyrimidine-DNA glycosylase
MPELPEVETVRRGLQPVMEGHRFVRVDQRRADLRFPFPRDFVRRLEGRTVVALDRRAKYLVGTLDDGTKLAMHLGMSGRFTIAQAGGANGVQLGEFAYDHGADPKHDHVVFTLSGGATVTYNDARRFGFMDLIPAEAFATHALFKGLGVEPLGPDLTPDYLARAARGRKTDLKAFLMDQRIISGLGNIYVCEALYRARLKPTARAGRLVTRSGKPKPVIDRLIDSIRGVLEEAIVAGGSTLRDYKQTDGSLGYFQKTFDVYGREGEACHTPRCAGTIHRRVQANRSTFYCKTCQTG